MKNIIKRSLAVLLMISLWMATAYPNVASAAKIKLNKTSLTLTQGKSYTLKVTGTSKKVTWKSNKKSVATVSKKGKITAKKAGKATIVATVSKKKYRCKVTVKTKKETTTKSTEEPIKRPTIAPTEKATVEPTQKPTERPTEKPTQKPTEKPTEKPTAKPTTKPTAEPTIQPTVNPEKKAVTGIKCYNVQDTNLNKNEGTGGKGDASIVDCGNKEYVMIDCGSETDYAHLRERILATCDKSYRAEYEGQKVYIPLLIISHNHKDHMGAIAPSLKQKEDKNADFTNKYLLEDSEIYVKEIVYTMVGPDNNCDTVKYAGGSVMTELVSKAQYDKADAETKKTYQYKITRNISNTNITIYGPAKKFGNHATDEIDANNSSMIVKVEGSMKALFLGDLCYDGLNAAKSTYGTELFSADYDFCKFGHHGYRTGSYCNKDGTLINGPGSEKEGTFSKEITLYNEYVNAKEYVFTASKKRLDGTYTNDKDITYNYLCLLKKLKRTDIVKNALNKNEEVKSTPTFYLGYATVGDWSSIGNDK